MNSCLSSFQQEREVQTLRLSTGFPKTLPSHGQLSTECDMLNISSFHKYLLSQALGIRRKQKRQVPALTDRLTGERNTKYFHRELEPQTSHGSHQLQEVVSQFSLKSVCKVWRTDLVHRCFLGSLSIYNARFWDLPQSYGIKPLIF